MADPEHAPALGLVFQRMSVFNRLRYERVSKRWKRAIRGWGWTEQRKLDLVTVFKGVPEGEVADRRRRFWANGYKNLISLLDLTRENLLELNLFSFWGEDLLPFIGEIAEALSQLPALQTLNIREFELSDFVDFLPPSLRRLKTDWFSVQTLEALAEKCPRLEKVPFHRVRGINLEVLNEFIGKFPSQKSLSIPYIYNSASRKIESYATVAAAIVRLEKLQALTFRGWYGLDAESFEAIVSGCPRLRRFSYKSGRLTEGALLRLAEMPSLVELEIYGNSGAVFSDAVLKAIARRKQLKSLVIPCSKLTDESIEYLLRECKSLVTLNLFCCRTITGRSLEAVVAELHRRYGNPPRVLPRGPLDPGIFYFTWVWDYDDWEEDAYRGEPHSGYHRIFGEWAKPERYRNPWLKLYEYEHLPKRKLY